MVLQSSLDSMATLLIHAAPHLGDKTSEDAIKSQTGYIKLRHNFKSRVITRDVMAKYREVER